MSINKFIGSSLLLFLDQSLVASGNWIYWLIISKITSTSEIGHATTVYSIVLLANTLTQLGLEYPLLRKSSISAHRSGIIGTTLVIELAITLASIPVVIYAIGNLYQESLQGFTWIAIGMLVLSAVGFVSRFALLGISDAKNVLIIDVTGTALKFALGVGLVSVGFGAFGILISFLLQALLISGATLFLVSRGLGFKLGNMSNFKQIIIDGLVNTPSKLSRLLILSLSVVLLAYLGIGSSEIGIFYVALMISVVVGSLASSMAYMLIPASSTSKTDLSSGSIRISLSLTAPLVAVLISSPRYILHLIGSQYASADTILLVLSIGILPSAIVITTISKFNNLDQSRKILSIGSIQTLSFLVAFFILVPHLGTLGAAFAMLIAFIAGSLPSVLWSERILIKYIVNSCIAIMGGASAGYLVRSASATIGFHPLAAIITSIVVTLGIILALKNTSSTEIRQLLGVIIKRR
jgi:O-antigen/teichoic acid export membrane protein